MVESIKALRAESIDGKPVAGFCTLTPADLPDYDVLVDVAYSSLNYKDGLAITGTAKIARRLPLVLGIDLAGTVAESRNPDWRPGDKIIINGYGLSESENGGYAQRQRVKSEWLVRLPDAFSLADAMAIGTAGYTAMLAVNALEEAGLVAGSREVVVTGAAGGVGSTAVALLSELGHRVVAVTGRPDTHDYLRKLGAADFLDRAALLEKGAVLQKERWAGAVDSVGGVTLANVLAQTAYGGAVAACGLAGGTDLPSSVHPFILRGVSLLGIDSVMAPMAKRLKAWKRLAEVLPKAKLNAMTTIEPMSKLPELAKLILAGKIRGRVAIDVNA
jgi:putative YhdH/YhfP family quinone oxidoreductase